MLAKSLGFKKETAKVIYIRVGIFVKKYQNICRDQKCSAKNKFLSTKILKNIEKNSRQSFFFRRHRGIDELVAEIPNIDFFYRDYV